MDLHALLIGIDKYDGGGSLSGCVNDVNAMQRVLRQKLGVPPERITRLVSPANKAEDDPDVDAALPEIANIRAALDRLGTEVVGPDERVLIFYSGHGTRLTLKDEDGRRFSREALLPKDKVRFTDTIYLPDWELNKAIAAISARCHALTVILDCCCSAGVTRDLGTDGAVRFWPTNDIQMVEAASELSGVLANVLTHGDNCQVIAACHADEKAKEAEEGGIFMGHLTRAFCERLETMIDESFDDLRWGQIWRQVEAGVNDRNPFQHPQISDGFARRVFGGDRGISGDMGLGIRKKGDFYEIEAGTLAGVTENTIIGVYGPEPHHFSVLGSPEDLEQRIGELEVKVASKASAKAVAIGEWSLPDGARGRVVRPGKSAFLRVGLNPHNNTLHTELETLKLIELVGSEEHPDIELVHVEEGWYLTDDIYGATDDEPRLPLIPVRPHAAHAMVEHYHRYSAPMRLARACRDLPHVLKISVLDCNGVALTAENGQTISLHEIAGSSQARNEVMESDRICFEVTNLFERELQVTLMNCAASGRVVVLNDVVLEGNSRGRFWLHKTIGTPFIPKVPAGMPIGVERLVVIGTTNRNFKLGHLATETTFQQVLDASREVTRSIRPAAQRAAPHVDQYTSTILTLFVRKHAN